MDETLQSPSLKVVLVKMITSLTNSLVEEIEGMMHLAGTFSSTKCTILPEDHQEHPLPAVLLLALLFPSQTIAWLPSYIAGGLHVLGAQPFCYSTPFLKVELYVKRGILLTCIKRSSLTPKPLRLC